MIYEVYVSIKKKTWVGVIFAMYEIKRRLKAKNNGVYRISVFPSALKNIRHAEFYLGQPVYLDILMRRQGEGSLSQQIRYIYLPQGNHGSI